MKKLLVYKHSKLEWDAHLTGLTRAQLIRKYESEGANVAAITKADEHQREVREWMEEALKCGSESLEDFTLLGSCNNDLVISLGGDNSFTRVSQFCRGHTTIVGINSDPDRSVGHMLQGKIYSRKDAEEIAEKLHRYSYTIEEWARVGCKINGRIIRPATSELFLGEKLRKNMSRHVLEHRLIDVRHKRGWEVPETNKQEQKCSGLIVATGAGSTGWLMSASQWSPWASTEKELRYMASEPYGRIDWTHYSDCIYPTDTLKITSLNDDGVISVDSWEEWQFNRGSVAEIGFAEPLKVMKFILDKEE